MHCPSVHPAPSQQRGAEAFWPPCKPGVLWLKHFHLTGRLWKQMLEHFELPHGNSCPVLVGPQSWSDSRVWCHLLCVPMQTAIATRAAQKATRVGRTLGWGCVCANPTSREHTVTSVPQATTDPAASVSTQHILGQTLTAASPGSPCWASPCSPPVLGRRNPTTPLSSDKFP